MDKSTLAWILLVLFLLLSVAVWCVASLVASTLAGWRELARHFPARTRPSGTRYGSQRGTVGFADYHGFLTIYGAAEGFFIYVWPPFRLGHPPLYIPYDEIRYPKVRRNLWFETVIFDVGEPAIAEMQLPKKVFKGAGFPF